MIIGDNIKKKIGDIIEKHFNVLLFKIAGKDNLPIEKVQELMSLGLIPQEMIEDGLMELAYYIGYLRPIYKPKKINLRQLRSQKREVLLSDVENYALKHVRESAGNYITKLKDFTQSKVKDLIDRKNLDYRNEVLTQKVRPIIEEGIAKRKTVAAIASDLRDSTKDLYRRWEVTATTELTNAVNLGAQDAMIKNSPDKSPKDIYVAKVVKSDSALCPSCKKFYVGVNGAPKVYRLSELQKNGDNVGRKGAELKPVVGSVHPRCRCQLIRIEEGWDFKDGELSYVGEGRESWRKNLK